MDLSRIVRGGMSPAEAATSEAFGVLDHGHDHGISQGPDGGWWARTWSPEKFREEAESWLKRNSEMTTIHLINWDQLHADLKKFGG